MNDPLFEELCRLPVVHYGIDLKRRRPTKVTSRLDILEWRITQLEEQLKPKPKRKRRKIIQ